MILVTAHPAPDHEGRQANINAECEQHHEDRFDGLVHCHYCFGFVVATTGNVRSRFPVFGSTVSVDSWAWPLSCKSVFESPLRGTGAGF